MKTRFLFEHYEIQTNLGDWKDIFLDLLIENEVEVFFVFGYVHRDASCSFVFLHRTPPNNETCIHQKLITIKKCNQKEWNTRGRQDKSSYEFDFHFSCNPSMVLPAALLAKPLFLTPYNNFWGLRVDFTHFMATMVVPALAEVCSATID